jgi:hypothetical protein
MARGFFEKNQDLVFHIRETSATSAIVLLSNQICRSLAGARDDARHSPLVSIIRLISSLTSFAATIDVTPVGS